jgi:hypothetical protein
MIFAGIGRDSDYVARKVMERSSKRRTGRLATAA